MKNHSFVVFPRRRQFPSPHLNRRLFPVLNDDLNRLYHRLWVVCRSVLQGCLRWLQLEEQSWDLLFGE